MTLAGVICAVLASAVIPAGNTRAETLAILLLALTFLAVAAFLTFFCSALGFYLDNFSGLLDAILMVVIVGTSIAGALWGAHLASRKTLAVHLQTFGLLASATCFFLPNVRSRGYSLVVAMFELDLKRIIGRIQLFEVLVDILVKADG